MTDEQIEQRFQQLEDRIYELERCNDTLESAMYDVKWEIERLKERI
jgi:prefoldin subunit 5